MNFLNCFSSHITCTSVADVRSDRLEFAKTLGADYTITVDKTYDGQRLAKEVVETLGEMPDVTIECSGAEVSIQAAIRVSIFSDFYDSVPNSRIYHQLFSMFYCRQPNLVAKLFLWVILPLRSTFH